MARNKGQFEFSANFQVKNAAPLDPRVAVDTKAELINKETWPYDGNTVYLYNGLLVAVNEEKAVYQLTNKDKALASDYSGWTRIDVNAGKHIQNIEGKQPLTIQLNGGSTEGTNKFTYNVESAKTVNITPSSIGAATSSHTHSVNDITGVLPISKGGTGASSVLAANYNLFKTYTKRDGSAVTDATEVAFFTASPNTTNGALHGINLGSIWTWISGKGVLTTGNYTSTLDSRYVNVSGDTMTGKLTLPSGSDAFNDASILFGSVGRIGGVTGGLGIYSTGSSIFLRPNQTTTLDQTKGLVVTGTTLKYNQQEVVTEGNTIALTGDVTGSAAFNSSGNVSITTTVANNSHTHTLSNISNLNATWAGILDDAPSTYVTRWPSISEVTGKQNLTVTLNGGTTEGTNKFTYNGTASKTINVTPSTIRAIAVQGTSFNQYDSGNYIKLCSFTTSKSVYDASISLRIDPKECQQAEMMFDLFIAVRLGSPTFRYVQYGGGSNRSFWVIGDGNNFEVWMNCIKTSYDGYGMIKVMNFSDSIRSYNFTLAYADSLPTNTYSVKATRSGYVDRAIKADQLYLSPTINGTTFNGTTNVTTANWGTARNIGIVNSDGTGTAVTTSVNGSANVNLKLPSTIKATLSGNASTASKLATARTISLTGDASGSASFDGSANILIPVTIANDSHTHATSVSSNATTNLTITAGGTTATIADLYATYADQLRTARTISLTGDVTGSTSFNGTGNVSITATVANNSHNHTFANISDKPLSRAWRQNSNNNITTSQFLDLLEDAGAFTYGWFHVRGDWSYASTSNITDTGYGTIDLAGCAITVWGSKNNCTILVIPPLNSSVSSPVELGTIYIYVNNGENYLSGWRKIARFEDIDWINIKNKPSSFTPSSHTHTISQISNLNGGWDSLLVNAPSAYLTRWPSISEVTGKQNFVVKLNGGTTEGTNQFTYNGTGAKTVNITPSGIGAAASSHTHNMNEISNASSQYVTAGTVTRKVFLCKNKTGNGWISRVALGLTNPTGQFSPAILSIGTNDGGTSWYDYTFTPDGHITNSRGEFALVSQIPSLSGYATQSWVQSQGFLRSATDTKNTAGSTNNTGKLYLIGAPSQAANPVTYSNSGVYTQNSAVYATNGFYETSDVRLKDFKEDIKTLDKIEQIPTKYFVWKDDEKQETQIGTSAQELQKIYPELVKGDDTLTVDYAKLSIVALAAIKELKAEIQSLKEEIKQLKSK